jgi:hypothetical protein
MSYEATIKLDDRSDKRFYVESSGDPKERVWFNFSTLNGSTHTFITPEQARELASALLDAAADVEPVDLTAQPIGVA